LGLLVKSNGREAETVIASGPVLDVACEISGPQTGEPMVLLHGWPDGPRTWDRVLPMLHEAGYRTIVPALRGCGGTHFKHADKPRTGQLAALGRDLIDTVDALELPACTVIGHYWGARAAYIAACLAPDRFSACIALSVGWGTNDPDQPLTLQQMQNYWYHWLMALPRGQALVREDRHHLTRYIWSIWTASGFPGEEEFAETALAFDNPDWADVVLHSYQVRWGNAPTDPAYADDEARLKADPIIRVPTLVLHGAADPCNAPETSDGKEHLFAGPYRREMIEGVGHFPQREAAEETAKRIVSFLNEPHSSRAN